MTREELIEHAMATYESPLIGYAATLLNDPDRARDVVQDTFVRLCQQDVAKVQGHLKSWLFTVCRNRAFDILRKDQRLLPLEPDHWQQLPAPTAAPDRQSQQQERLAAITRLLERLPENQRDVILLKFQQGLSYREIHEVTGLSSGNIGFLIHTGLNRVRQWLPANLLD